MLFYCLFILLLVFFIIVMERKFRIEKKTKWMVVLTTVIYPKAYHNRNFDESYRKDLYMKQLTRWLEETELPIVVVESSGTDWIPSTLKTKWKHRLQFYTFELQETVNSSVAEAQSLQYVFAKLRNDQNYNTSSHILKVTGRYFLPNIENKLEVDQEHDVYDLYLQHHRHDEVQWHNCEYIGMKKKLWFPFLDMIVNKYQGMEHALYHFSQKNYKVKYIGPFQNTVFRGGALDTIHDLYIDF